MRPENGERSSPRCSLIYSINGGRGGEGRASLPGRRLTAKIVAFARLLSLGIYIYIYIYIYSTLGLPFSSASRVSRASKVAGEEERERAKANTPYMYARRKE